MPCMKSRMLDVHVHRCIIKSSHDMLNLFGHFMLKTAGYFTKPWLMTIDILLNRVQCMLSRE